MVAKKKSSHSMKTHHKIEMTHHETLAKHHKKMAIKHEKNSKLSEKGSKYVTDAPQENKRGEMC